MWCQADIYIFRPQASSALFFQHNTQLGPPYHVIVDTNFINFSIQNKLELVAAMMDCLFAKCTQLPIYFFIRSLTQNNRHTVHYGLRDGRIGKIRETIQSCLTVSKKIANVFFSLTRKFRVAKDSRFKRLKCTHKGTYADDCIVSRVMMHKCYIVATCDKDLKRRIRKIPGVPIMYISQRKYTVERMPESLVRSFSSFLGFSSFYYLLYDEKTET